MNILAINTAHDSSACLFNDFDLVAYAKEERLNRVKSWGHDIPWLSLQEIFKKCPAEKIDCLVLLRGPFPLSCYRRLSHRTLGQQMRFWMREKFLKEKRPIELCNEMNRSNKWESDLLDFDKVRRLLGLRRDCEITFANHHLCHALPTLFYSPDWKTGLIYTADGVGDKSHYSIYSFNENEWTEHYGGDHFIFERDTMSISMGRLYGTVTRAAGFKENRHEGKITGLAAYGKPVLLDELRSRYFLNKAGNVESTVLKNSQMDQHIFDAAKTIKVEDLAASVQKHLEEIMLQAVQYHLKANKCSNVGLSGGVFANVRANQVIAESEGVQEAFIYPAMGDEGLSVGAALKVCFQKWGLKEFLKKRRDLGMPYYGEEFSQARIASDAAGLNIQKPADVAMETAKLVNENKICALFTKGMEFGPRALGARSILANPKNREINQTLNERLTRTEFMPFAPVVREERLQETFQCPAPSVRATKYMTITTAVQEKWRDRIPAVVHIDGTARPQSIARGDNSIYYDILERFEEISGLPCMINTSFNAHEEPIINTPREALKALTQKRIDYLVTDEMIISNP